ncbi:TauD/TfdA family dioxygenase [Prescottella defluvii]|uniref:TauD/TfdA family dioxygenase n=1 Tax=Prescottella defluvii TaxID=1323361 RepID=UPI0039E8A65B
MFNIVDLPADVRIADAQIRGDNVEVEFAPDGHRSTFSLRQLLSNAGSGYADARAHESKQLWFRAADLPTVERVDWEAYLSDPSHALQSVVDRGFAVLCGVPTEPGQVVSVAERFGFVRETNYGKIFDVRVEENPVNLAFTGRAISPHTDNPYRDPVPTLQLLHCLHNTAVGGESGLVDGFAAAVALRETDPESFEVLTTTQVVYRFGSENTRLAAQVPLISLDSQRRIREIRFNNRSIEVPRMATDQQRRFYAAYRSFAELIYAPEAQLNFQLDPGDCLIFDNTRLLHSRTAFASAGGRHLQGAYADLDGLLSTLQVAEGNR